LSYERIHDNELIIGKACRVYVMWSTFLLFSAGFSYTLIFIVVSHFCEIIILVVLPLLENDCCLAPQLFQLNYDINKFFLIRQWRLLYIRAVTWATYSLFWNSSPWIDTNTHLDILYYNYVIQHAHSWDSKYQFKNSWLGGLSPLN